MFIEYLKIENYRQYKGPINLKFSTDSDKNFTIIKGTNGAGKTNLLNAITWCLYEEELHKISKNQKSEIYNDTLINKTNHNETFQVKIELGILDAKEQKITISRKQKFTKKDNKILKDPSGSELSVQTLKKGINKNHTYPELYIDSNLPEKIEGYFFFDGEKLEDYFDDNSRENIKESVFNISQINLFKNLNQHLNSLKRSILRDLKELKTDLTDYLEKKTMLEDKIIQNEENIQKTRVLQDRIKKGLKSVEEELREIDHREKDILINQRKSLESEIKKLNKEEDELTRVKKNFIIEYFPLVLSYLPFKKFIELSSSLEEKGFIPHLYRKKFLEVLMEDEKCICGNELKVNSDSYKEIQKLHSQTSGVTNISEEVNIELEGLKNRIKDIQGFSNKRKKYNRKIREIKNNIRGKKEELENTKSKFEKIDHEEINRLTNIKKDLEDQKEKFSEEIGYQKKSKESASKKLSEVEKKIINVERDNKKALKLKDKLDFVKNSIEASESLEDKLIENIRKKIEKHTNEQFKKLMWKENFIRAKVNEDYDITVVDRGRGLVYPNDISAGERLALALSFVAALNQISGFNLPLIIDTPMGRLDKEIKTNIAKTFPDYVKGKQVVLLVTGEEYTEDFKNDILENIGTEYEIKVFETGNGTKSEIL